MHETIELNCYEAEMFEDKTGEMSGRSTWLEERSKNEIFHEVFKELVKDIMRNRSDTGRQRFIEANQRRILWLRVLVLSKMSKIEGGVAMLWDEDAVLRVLIDVLEEDMKTEGWDGLDDMEVVGFKDRV